MYFFLLAYPLLGAGIKFIDAAFDEKTFSKKLAVIIAPLLGVLWAYTMFINSVSATILLAVVVGVFVTGKIDNYAHLIGMLSIFLILLFIGVELMVIPLIFLILAGTLDEIGNDRIDKKKNHLDKNKFSHKFAIIFFEHRWTLKVAILIMAIVGVIPFYFFLAMIFFDYAYITVRVCSDIKQDKSSSHFIKKALAAIGVFNK